jgi:5'-nucleotidase
LATGRSIRWAFLDVGNVLLDEDPLSFFVFRRHVAAIRHARPDRTFAGLLAQREARALAGSRWPVFDVISEYLDPAEVAKVWVSADRDARASYGELTPPIAGAADLIDQLSMCYRLGLIANQPREARARLAELGWLGRFEVVALSEEEGLAKPDAGLFRRALERAGAEPSECVMIGDRLDNDVAPAAALGMATALVRWPVRSEKGWGPSEPESRNYLRSLERVAVEIERRSATRPTVDVGGLAGLVRAVEGLARA